ncbi:hypothetical protein ACP70R_008058 [Stipagrostis hirtigluma subsp. patula]
MSSEFRDPVDLEIGAAGLKAADEAEEEQLTVVDTRVANCINVSLDVFFVVYLLFYIGSVVLLVMVSDHWWDPWPGVLILSPIFIATLWMTPKMKEVYIRAFATKPLLGNDNDLSAKLLK